MSTSSTSRASLALDLDGTLIDPKPRQVAVMTALFEGEATMEPVRPADFWSLKRDGLTTAEALERLGVERALAGKLALRWARSVEDLRWLRLDRLIPGVDETLGELAEAGTRPAILTARRHEDRVRDQVSSLGLLRWCDEVQVVSPESAVEQKAAELEALGSRGFVGDTESDARAAELAGVAFAGVTTGQRAGEFLRARGLPAFDSLADALRALPG